jgi:uncharacterized protein involved in tolerance to divalent cations
MTEKLSYEEWCVKYKGTVIIPEDVRKDIKDFHDLNVDELAEWAIRKEYEFYLNWNNE